jgi:hypothetical protein
VKPALAFALVTLLGLLGCGASNAPAYLGTWSSSSSETEVCPDGTHVTPLVGTLQVVAGTAGGTVVTQTSNGCDLTWTVSGNTANLDGTQVCNVAGSAGGTWTATFTAGTLTLGAGNLTLTLGDSGTGVLLLDGVAQDCTFTQAGTWTKS